MTLNILILIQHPPFHYRYSLAMNLLLAGSSSEQRMTLCLTEASVFSLLPNIQPQSLLADTSCLLLKTLSLYDIQPIYVEATALTQRHIDPQTISIPIELVTSQQLYDLIATHDHVFTS